MPLMDFLPACLFGAFAASLLAVSLRLRLWLTDFWRCMLGLVTLVVIAVFVPTDAFLDETTRSVALFLGCGSIVVLPLARALYSHWSQRAELAAQHLAARGNYYGAIMLLERERSYGRPSLVLLNNLAYYLHHVGKIEEALDAVEEAEGRYGPQRELTIKKALCLARLGEKDESLALFAPLIDNHPDDLELAHQYTCLLLQLNLRAEAERQFDRAELLFFREPSEQRKQEWRRRLEKLRRVLADQPGR